MTPQKGVADDQLGQYYRRVSAIADRLGKSLSFQFVMDMLQRIHDGFVRRVRVDRTRTPVQIIDATGRFRGYIDEKVLAEMPLAGREEDDVIVFELDYDPTVDELDREYESRDLKPDPSALAQAMTDDPAFADERPIAVYWRNSNGQACYAIFVRWEDDGRGVHVGCSDDRWSRSSRFAGVRK